MAVIGVDIGTSSCRAAAFDPEGRALSFAQVPISRAYSAGGRVEIDAGAFLAAFRQAVAQAVGEARQPVQALACSVLGGALSAIDARGNPVLPIISTTDSRARQHADAWSRDFGRERTYDICGLPVSPTLNLPKILAVRSESPETFSRVSKFVSPGELALHSLGAPVVTDLAMASTWMALDLRTANWSDAILNACGLDRSVLPGLARPGEIIGLADASAAEVGLKPGTALVAGGHDQQVCALGAGLIRTGIATDSLGSVECITTGFEGPRFDPLLRDHNYSCLYHVYGGLFVSLAYNFCSGDLLQWYMRTFCGRQPDDGSLSALLASLPETPAALLVLPHFAGSGTPTLDPLSRGAIVGLRLDSEPEDVLKAILDCQNYEMRVNIELWAQAGLNPSELRAYGGGAQDDYALQLKADVLNLPVHRLSVREAGCLGAAALAAAAVGDVPDAAEFVRSVSVERVFEPRPDVHAAHEENYNLYKQIYERLAPITHGLAGH
jgi:xylulokinase